MFISSFSKEWKLKNDKNRRGKKLSTPKTVYKIIKIKKKNKLTLKTITLTNLKDQSWRHFKHRYM